MSTPVQSWFHSFLADLSRNLPREEKYFLITFSILALVLFAGFALAKAGLWKEHFIPPVLASCTAVLGILNIFSTLSPRIAGRLTILRTLAPLELRQGSHAGAILAGFALLFISSSLVRRKRVAWVITVALLFLSSIANIGKGLDYEESFNALILAGFFFRYRKSFHALSDYPSIRQGLVALFMGAVATFAYGSLGFNLAASRHRRAVWLGQTLQATFSYLTTGALPDFMSSGGRDSFFLSTLTIVAVSCAAYTLVMVLRPVLIHAPSSPAERGAAAALIAEHGSSVLDHYSLFEDKSLHFSPGGSVCAFVLSGRHAIVLKGPIGPENDRSAAIVDFVAFCGLKDWTPVFYQTDQADLPLYSAAGFKRSMSVGMNAEVVLSEFSMSGKKSQDFRTALNRLKASGYRLHVSYPPHPLGFVDSLRETSEEWLTRHGGMEQRFALGRFDTGYLGGCPIVAVEDKEGHPVAFANLLPEFHSGSIGIDLMRYGSGAPNGTMDAVFATAVEWAKERGYARLNFGLSSLAGVGEHPDEPLLERALAKAIPVMEKYYGFRGLHAYKDKFGPEWIPKYIVCPSWADLVPALVAVIEAHAERSIAGYLLSSRLKRQR